MLARALCSDSHHNYWTNGPREVYDDNKALFHQYKYENFRNNLNSLKKAIRADREFVKFDNEAVERQLARFPRGELTEHGKIIYDTSETKKILTTKAKDKSLDKYLGRPSELYSSNEVFRKEFTLGDFRGHVNRAKQAANEEVGWQHRRNGKGSEMKNAWFDRRGEEVHKK